MNWLHAIILGIVEGVTEFLPVSSTGHLTIVEQMLGYKIDAPEIVAFTAVVQVGAIAAAVVYFWRDIWRIAAAWCVGIFDPNKRNFDYKMGWYVILGSLPIAIVGLIFKDTIETTLRGMWFVAIGLIVWSLVLLVADHYGKESRHERDTKWLDALIMGAMQCFALIPGVSRSGATIAGGLFRGITRETSTRLSFFLGIPALLAAGGLEAITQAQHIDDYIGWPVMIAGILVSFVVGYASIAWLLKFVSKHSFTPFVVYRIALGALIIVLLSLGIWN